jgi:hypothetical protein
VRFTVRGDVAADLMNDLASGHFPEITVHEFEIVDWRAWWGES